VGFPQYGFKLRDHAVRSVAFRLATPRFSPIPDIPAAYRAFATAFGTGDHQQGSPPLCADLWRSSSPLSPEVLAPAGFCCPCLPRLATSSASLKTSTALPSMARYSGGLWHARILLPGLHTFRTFPTVLSRIAVCSFRRESGTCTPPCFRPSAGHRVEGRNPWHLQHSRNQLHAGTHCRRLVRSLSLRPSWLLASWADQTENARRSQPSLGLYVRASSPQVTPRTAGYDYGAKWGIAPAGLPPASTTVSLAAPPPLQGASPAKTRASSRPSRAHGPHLRSSTNCEKLSERGYRAATCSYPPRPFVVPPACNCRCSHKSSRSYWIPEADAPVLSEKRNAFLSLLKNKGFKEERMTKVGLYAIGTSTTLESNKSHRDKLQ